MANPAHVALLRQGIAEWNDWRAQNGSVTPDLTGLRMPAAALAGVDLSHARLRGATLIRSKLVGADLRHADLRDASLHEVVLDDADLFRANLANATLASAKLRRATLLGANLSGARMTVVDFRDADLRGARFNDTDLRESLGMHANLAGADLTGAELGRCDLSGCNLENSRGLTPRQLELAVIDANTRVPEPLAGPEPAASIEALCRSLESLKARATGDTVPETEVSSYHSLLDQLVTLHAAGVDVDEARIREEELVRPVTAWERTPGGEAFEADARMWVDGSLFRRRVDEVIARLK